MHEGDVHERVRCSFFLLARGPCKTLQAVSTNLVAGTYRATSDLPRKLPNTRTTTNGFENDGRRFREIPVIFDCRRCSELSRPPVVFRLSQLHATYFCWATRSFWLPVESRRVASEAVLELTATCLSFAVCCSLDRELLSWLSNTTAGFDSLTHRVHESEVSSQQLQRHKRGQGQKPNPPHCPLVEVTTHQPRNECVRSK